MGFRQSARQSPYERTLCEALRQYFSKDEISSLCLDLAIDGEELDVSTKGSMAEDLVALTASQGRLPQLARLVKTARPQAPIGAAQAPGWPRQPAGRSQGALYRPERWDEPAVG